MKRMVTIFAVCMFLVSLQYFAAEGRRVVFLPVPSPSHAKYHAKVAQAVHKLGHQVWIALPNFLLEKGITDTSNLSVIPYHMSKNYHDIFTDMLVTAYFAGQVSDVFKTISITMPAVNEILQNKDLEQTIHEIQPDLIVLDNSPTVYTLLVLPYKLDVPFAMMGTLYDVHSMRIPYSSAVNVLQIGMTCADDMKFFERLKSMFSHSMLYVYNPFMPHDVVSTYAPERPYIANHELMVLPEIWLVEMDHIMDYPRPTLPNVKLIGGTVTEQAKPLPPELQAFMDSATHGVVIVTFGGSILGVPKHISDKLFQVFEDLPYKVVFRSNLTSPDPAKVLTSKWLPQNDLLGHPNTKVFVSHCGKNGQYEALYHAVPILCNLSMLNRSTTVNGSERRGLGKWWTFAVSPRMSCSAVS